MKIDKNNGDFELDYYLKIIDNFKNTKINQETREIGKNRSLIELMKLLDRTKNIDMISNAIIIILSLFEEMPPDGYNNRGISIHQIPHKDKRYLKEQLKEEFLLPN